MFWLIGPAASVHSLPLVLGFPHPRVSVGTLWPGHQALHGHSLPAPSASSTPWNPKLRTQQTTGASQYAMCPGIPLGMGVYDCLL